MPNLSFSACARCSRFGRVWPFLGCGSRHAGRFEPVQQKRRAACRRREACQEAEDAQKQAREALERTTWRWNGPSSTVRGHHCSRQGRSWHGAGRHTGAAACRAAGSTRSCARVHWGRKIHGFPGNLLTPCPGPGDAGDIGPGDVGSRVHDDRSFEWSRRRLPPPRMRYPGGWCGRRHGRGWRPGNHEPAKEDTLFLLTQDLRLGFAASDNLLKY